MDKFKITNLGTPKILSPIPLNREGCETINFINDRKRILLNPTFDLPKKRKKTFNLDLQTSPSFELAGPREKIFFDPSKLKCGIVTCGGICPGLNDVIRAIVLSLFHHYGVPTVFGFRYGYEGLSPRHQHVPMGPEQRIPPHHQLSTMADPRRPAQQRRGPAQPVG